MSRRRVVKNRNPIARVVRSIRPQVVPDRRRAERERVLDEMVAESERLGLYDDPPVPLVTADEREMLLDRRFGQQPFEGPEKRGQDS